MVAKFSITPVPNVDDEAELSGWWYIEGYRDAELNLPEWGMFDDFGIDEASKATYLLGYADGQGDIRGT